MHLYRLIALMSVVMKSFERLVSNHRKQFTGPLLDPLPSAYRSNRVTTEAANMGLNVC